MSGPRRWAVLETEFLQDCAVFSVSRTLAKSPRTGDHHPFFRIDSSDWVNIIPITPDGDIVMVRQYRHGLDGFTVDGVSFPRLSSAIAQVGIKNCFW